LYKAQAHAGVGGSGAGACSADLLLGALAACAQITCQMVAEGLQIPVRSVRVPVEGDLDLRGILGPADQAPVGFSAIRMRFDIDAPDASSQQIESLREKSERYCVVYQTLVSPPVISTSWTQP
jgi:uncharacterized OsmC-like protein